MILGVLMNELLLPAAKPRRSMDDKPPPSNNESLVAFRGQRSMVT